MPDPRKVLSTIRRATELVSQDPGSIRQHHLARRRRPTSWSSATCTATSIHSRKCSTSAALDRHPERHLVLQELIHGPLSYPGDGGDRSHQLLDVVAALKCQYPDRAHLILGNHELSELTGRVIGKDGETLNAKFLQGSPRPTARRLSRSMTPTRPSSPHCRWRSARRIASTSATQSPMRAISTRSSSTS